MKSFHALNKSPNHVQAALANNGHNIFQTALALNDSHTAPAKPPPLSRSISEKLYEDMGRIHSMHAVRRALDTSGRDNPMHARRVLEQNPLDYNRYCCIEMQQDEPEENFELECSLCYTEFDENDTDLMCLPCGLRTCRTCLQVGAARCSIQCCHTRLCTVCAG